MKGEGNRLLLSFEFWICFGFRASDFGFCGGFNGCRLRVELGMVSRQLANRRSTGVNRRGNACRCRLPGIRGRDSAWPRLSRTSTHRPGRRRLRASLNFARPHCRQAAIERLLPVGFIAGVRRFLGDQHQTLGAQGRRNRPSRSGTAVAEAHSSPCQTSNSPNRPFRGFQALAGP